jgi:hypothetical protein
VIRSRLRLSLTSRHRRERRKTTTAATALAEMGQAVKQLRTRSEDVGAPGLPGEELEFGDQLTELEDMLDQARRRVES